MEIFDNKIYLRLLSIAKIILLNQNVANAQIEMVKNDKVNFDKLILFKEINKNLLKKFM